MIEHLKPVIKELKARLNEVYRDRLANLVLFGSQARGDAVTGSDIDILVVLKGPVSAGKEISRISGITSSLSLLYDVVISCTFVSDDRYKKEKSPLILNIHREGVQV